MNFIKRKYEDWRLGKYYLSIKEVPMYNWICLHDENDLRYLSKTGKVCNRLGWVYEKLQNEIMDNFGINEDFLQILKNKIKIELHYAHQIKTKDRSNQLFIDILELKNEEIRNKTTTKAGLFDSIVIIEKIMGFQFDIKKNTVFDFYKYSKAISNKLSA